MKGEIVLYYKQIIVVNKELNMSKGKMAAQVSHASMAFLTKMIQKNTKEIFENQYPAWEYTWNNDFTDIIKRPQMYRRDDLHTWAKEARDRGEDYFYARPIDPNNKYGKLELCEPISHYETNFQIDKDLYDRSNSKSKKALPQTVQDTLELAKQEYIFLYLYIPNLKGLTNGVALHPKKWGKNVLIIYAPRWSLDRQGERKEKPPKQKNQNNGL